MTKRPILTRITPQTDKEWPADHPIRRVAKVATPDEMGGAEFVICRRASDPLPPDVSTAVEFRATCMDCGEPIMHRALPNPNVQLICIYCWHGMLTRSREADYG